MRWSSKFRQDSTCLAVLRYRVRYILITGLSPSVARFSKTVHLYISFVTLNGTRAVPRSFATTSGIAIAFFSCSYWDVSVHCVLFQLLGCHCWRVAPFGNPRISAHLLLPEAYRRSSRPSSASNAKASTMRLISLTLLYNIYPLFKDLLKISLWKLNWNVIKREWTLLI